MEKIFYKCYKLIKDIPRHEAGEELRWCVLNGQGQYYFMKKEKEVYDWSKSEDFSVYHDFDGEHYTIEEVESSEFFEPQGRQYDFIPKFPSKAEIEEFYLLRGEARLVDDVDFIRACNPIFRSNEYYDACYQILKRMYEKKYGETITHRLEYAQEKSGMWFTTINPTCQKHIDQVDSSDTKECGALAVQEVTNLKTREAVYLCGTHAIEISNSKKVGVRR